MGKEEHLPWEWIRSKDVADLILFKARFDWYQNPRNQQRKKAVILQAPDWVNVVALTPDQHVVIVQQYRFGTREITSEIPAGIVEEDELPQQAAMRELKEETGYTSQEWTSMDYVQPNPAFLDNRCYLFLAKNARRTHSPQLDAGEHIRTQVMDRHQVAKEINAGRMRHSLALAALARVFEVWSIKEI